MPAIEHYPIIMVAGLLLLAFIMPLLYIWKRNWCEPVAIFAISVALVMSLCIIYEVVQGDAFEEGYWMGGWEHFGIEFKADYLSSYMLAVIHGVGLLILIYGIGDLKKELVEKVRGWYYTLYLLLMGAMSGMALTNDLFNLFVFMEIVAISACAIISIKEDRECLEASFKYLILSAMGTGCYLLSVAMIYMITGYMNLDMVGETMALGVGEYPLNILVAMSLMVVSFGVKSALFPLHVWLPDAHASAPSPSSAVLSGLVIKIYAVALVHILFRAFPMEILKEVPMTDIILWMSTLGIIFGSIFAMVQENFKKMLAYSSIAQIGYVFMGIGLFDPERPEETEALVGGLLHILNHAVMKSMLFMIAGIIIYSAGLKKIRDFDGIGNRLKWPMYIFIIGSASMVGIPITGGFMSKLHLAQGAIAVDMPFFVMVIIASSLLNAIYYMPIFINAFLSESKHENVTFKPVPGSMMIPVVILGGLVLLFGIYPAPVIGVLESAVESLIQ